MLGFDGEYPATHPKAKFWWFFLEKNSQKPGFLYDNGLRHERVKDSIKVKRTTKTVSKCHFHLYFPIYITKIANYWWKMMMSVEFNGCVAQFLCFLYFLWVRCKCAEFCHCGICVTDFRYMWRIIDHKLIIDQCSPSYRDQSIDLHCKSITCFYMIGNIDS